MFRAISGGKFEESYKEILPILPTFLNGLYRIYIIARNVQLRFSILEISLSIPARLSSLLPHLPLLLRLIIPALNTGVAEITNLA
jgi:transformation/transcription domain-associated protein